MQAQTTGNEKILTDGFEKILEIVKPFKIGYSEDATFKVSKQNYNSMLTDIGVQAEEISKILDTQSTTIANDLNTVLSQLNHKTNPTEFEGFKQSIVSELDKKISLFGSDTDKIIRYLKQRGQFFDLLNEKIDQKFHFFKEILATAFSDFINTHNLKQNKSENILLYRAFMKYPYSETTHKPDSDIPATSRTDDSVFGPRDLSDRDARHFSDYYSPSRRIDQKGGSNPDSADTGLETAHASRRVLFGHSTQVTLDHSPFRMESESSPQDHRGRLEERVSYRASDARYQPSSQYPLDTHYSKPSEKLENQQLSRVIEPTIPESSTGTDQRILKALRIQNDLLRRVVENLDRRQPDDKEPDLFTSRLDPSGFDGRLSARNYGHISTGFPFNPTDIGTPSVMRGSAPLPDMQDAGYERYVRDGRDVRDWRDERGSAPLPYSQDVRDERGSAPLPYSQDERDERGSAPLPYSQDVRDERGSAPLPYSHDVRDERGSAPLPYSQDVRDERGSAPLSYSQDVRDGRDVRDWRDVQGSAPLPDMQDAGHGRGSSPLPDMPTRTSRAEPSISSSILTRPTTMAESSNTFFSPSALGYRSESPDEGLDEGLGRASVNEQMASENLLKWLDVGLEAQASPSNLQGNIGSQSLPRHSHHVADSSATPQLELGQRPSPYPARLHASQGWGQGEITEAQASPSNLQGNIGSQSLPRHSHHVADSSATPQLELGQRPSPYPARSPASQGWGEWLGEWAYSLISSPSRQKVNSSRVASKRRQTKEGHPR